MLRNMSLLTVLLAAGCAGTNANTAGEVTTFGARVALCVGQAWADYESSQHAMLLAPSSPAQMLVAPAADAADGGAPPEPGK